METTCRTSKTFIKAQPSSTLVGVGYMANAGVNVAQNFTQDHNAAINAIRLPRGNLSTMDSPYLSLISLVKGWPQQKVRREVLMVTDGIDRLRGESPQLSPMGPNSRMGANSGMGLNRGWGRAMGRGCTTACRRSAGCYNGERDQPALQRDRFLDLWCGRGTDGQEFLGCAAGDIGTGQDCGGDGRRVLLAEHDAAGELQTLPGTAGRTILRTSTSLEFEAVPKGKKGSLQRVKIEAEIPNSELLAPDNVWVEPPTSGTGK